MRLRALGFVIEFEPVEPALLAAIKKDPPDAVVIDLSRLPSHGPDMALYLRQANATRSTPLDFVGGAAAKVEGIRRQLPDAEYASWEKIAPALAHAIAHPPKRPIKPSSTLAGYSGALKLARRKVSNRSVRVKRSRA